MVARDMLERRHWYKRGLEHWAFEITNGNGRLVGVVPFCKLGKYRVRSRAF